MGVGGMGDRGYGGQGVWGTGDMGDRVYGAQGVGSPGEQGAGEGSI